MTWSTSFTSASFPSSSAKASRSSPAASRNVNSLSSKTRPSPKASSPSSTPVLAKSQNANKGCFLHPAHNFVLCNLLSHFNLWERQLLSYPCSTFRDRDVQKSRG